MEKRRMIQCFLPYLAIHQCSAHYCLKRAKGNTVIYCEESSSAPLFIFPSIEEHGKTLWTKVKFSGTCKYHREQMWQLTFSLHKYIFFFSILRGAQLPEPWSVLHTPLNIFSMKLSGVFRNGFWTSPVSTSLSQANSQVILRACSATIKY